MMATNVDTDPTLFVGLDGGYDPYNNLDGPGAGSPQSNPSSSSPSDLISNHGLPYANGSGASPGLAVPATTNGTNGNPQQAFFDPNSPPNWDFVQNPPQFDQFGGNPFDPAGILQQQQWGFQPSPGTQQQLQTGTDPKATQYNNGASISPPLYASNGASVAELSPSPLPSDPRVVRHNPPESFLNSLTPAQQEKLKSIAMPAHLQYHSPKSEPSPSSSAGGHDKRHSGSSPGGSESKGGSRKRKSSADVDDDDDDEDGDGQQPVKKTAHNMIEKRYRTNLNDKIAALRDSVPALRIMTKSARGEDTTEDREELQGLTPAHKLNKATVLSKATEYIRHLEKRNNRLSEEVNSMQARISAFEKLFMAGALGTTMPSPMQQTTQLQYPQDTQAFMNTAIPTGRANDPPGMIPVPEDVKRILAAQTLAAGRPYPVAPQSFQGNNAAILRQQQIQQQQQMQTRGWANSGPYFGKLMVGSLAGLMIVEAVRESEQSNDSPEGRGLFGVPVQLLRSFVNSTHFNLGGYHVSTAQFFSTLKVLVLFGALLWVFVPSIFAPKPRKSHKVAVTRSLEAVPSLASPIHVRRSAWLTAIQTVWVPRHNFFLEAAALILKTLKFTLRNTIGTRGYQMLTGLTEEQETARVKAWMIALDAQLAGGDVEINKSRLTLTLLASGTLPDTPQRLMLKALHIRVLLWQSDFFPNVINMAAASFARSKWLEARQLNRLLVQLRKGASPPADDEPLPDHLAVLLEQDPDDVLSDDIIQRAHNLAWNRPTTYNVSSNIDGMNAVVEDPAVRSPMDAVCAWYSSVTLQSILAASLEDRKDRKAASSTTPVDLDLAIKVAPIGSNAQIRALVARTFISSEKRGASIAAAMQAMAPTENPDKHPHYASGVPPLIDSPTVQPIIPDPDTITALRCSQAMAHLQKYASPPRWALDVINSTILTHAREGMSLLGFAAAFHLMVCLDQHAVGREACAVTLERLAGCLRVWVGGVDGDVGGLGEESRCKLVERCLKVTKSVVGMEADPGYGSMSECEGETGEAGC